MRVLEAVAEVNQSLGMMGFVAVLYFLVPTIIGGYGNDWRRSKLTQKGYILTKTLDADNPDAAITAVPRDSETGVQTSVEAHNAENVGNKNYRKAGHKGYCEKCGAKVSINHGDAYHTFCNNCA